MADDYYAVFGVEPDADPDEIRKVYVSLARRHHPDLQGDDEAVGAAAERRMQRINEAWAVLSDPARREHYDLVVAGPTFGSPGGVVQTPQRREWQPFGDDDDGDDDVDPRDLIDDVPIGDGGRIPRAMQMAPPLLVSGAILVLIVGLMTGLMPIVALALSALGAGVVLFVATPFVAVLRSRTSERNANA